MGISLLTQARTMSRVGGAPVRQGRTHARSKHCGSARGLAVVLRFGVALTVHAVLSMSSEAAGLKTKHRKACELGKKRPRFSQYSIPFKAPCLAVAAAERKRHSHNKNLAECLFFARASAAVADKAHRRIPLAPPLQTGRRWELRAGSPPLMLSHA